MGDNGGPSPTCQPIGYLAQRIGGVKVNDVRASPHERHRLGQAERHGGNRGQPARFDDAHAVQRLHLRAPTRATHQDDDLMPGRRLSFSQHLDVVLYAP